MLQGRGKRVGNVEQGGESKAIGDEGVREKGKGRVKRRRGLRGAALS